MVARESNRAEEVFTTMRLARPLTLRRRAAAVLILAAAALWAVAPAIAVPRTEKTMKPVEDNDVPTTASTIPGMAQLNGNPNLLGSGIPEIPAALKARVKQYLNARGAGLLDVTPDGAQVLMTTRFADTAQLHLLEMPMGARQQITFFDEPTAQGTFVPGDPDTLFYLQDVGGGEFYQIFRLDRRTGRSTLLTDGKSRHDSLTFARDGKQYAFQSNRRNGKDTDVFVAPTAEPAHAVAVTTGTGTWYPGTFSPDGKRLLVAQYRSIDDSDLHVVDLPTGKTTQLTPREGKGSVRAAAFAADGKGVYLVTDRFSDFNELYLIDPAKPAAEPKPLSRDIKWDVEDLAVADDGSAVAFATNEDGISRVHVLSPKTGKTRHIEVPEGCVSSLKFPEKRCDRLFFSIDSPRSPSDIYHADLATGKLVRWTKSEVGGLDTSTFVIPTVVRYPSTDGVTVPALYYKPVGASPQHKRPVVVIWHGGPEGQSRPNYSSLLQLLARDLGIAVLMPNVRGSDGYGKAFLALDNGVKREASLNDIGATLDWIGRQPELDPARVAAYGGSYGGYMTLATLAFQPGRVKAGVAVVAISSIPTFLENTQDYRRDLRRAEYGDERDPEVRKVLERISPLTAVDKIDAALFVQQGANDPRVPQSEAEQIVQAVRRKGRPVWYLLALNEGHGFARKENRDIALMAMVSFLRDQLLVGEPEEGP